MKLKFGSVMTREGSEVLSLATSKRRVFSTLKRSAEIQHTWVARGRIIAANLTALQTEMSELEAAFSGGANDLSWVDDTSSTIVGHSLSSGDTQYGVYCTGIQWLPTKMITSMSGSKVEYVTTKGYIIQFQATELNKESNIVDWNETLTQYGGGGNFTKHVTSFTGKPEAQTINTYTPIRMVQQGTSVGYDAYVDYPAPIYPSHVISNFTRYNYSAPKYYANKTMYYGRGWTYVSSHIDSSDVPSGSLQAPIF